MCTREDTLAHILGAPYIDDVMSHNDLTTNIFQIRKIETGPFSARAASWTV